MQKHSWTLAMALSIGVALSQVDDGKARYEMLCGACHGLDGKGLAGQFPPLAGSDWVKGNPERMGQVVLHGLEGPVTVGDKEYNLAMPPQGSAMTDEQIAAVITYVRSSWGHAESQVSAAEVATMRQNTKQRSGMWQADELLERWPLDQKAGPLKNLVASTYKGQYDRLPDFSKLQPTQVTEEKGGYLAVSQSGMEDGFGMVWEGELEVPKDGKFEFVLDSDDGSRLFINGEKLLEISDIGPLGRAKTAKVNLTKGTAKVRVEYFEARGQEGLSLAWSGPGVKRKLLSQGNQKEIKLPPSVPIVVGEEARIYRNFIAGTSPRGIAVGYPTGVNLSFSADELGLGAIWLGDFIDGGRHWTERGQGFVAPSGRRVVQLGGQPAFATFSGNSWPQHWQEELPFRFGGYSLDEQRRPEFRYEVAGIQIKDKSYEVSGDKFCRTLVFQVNKETPPHLALRLAGPGVLAKGSHLFDLGEGAHLEIAQSEHFEPTLVDGMLVLKLKLPSGESRLGLRYVWK